MKYIKKFEVKKGVSDYDTLVDMLFDSIYFGNVKSVLDLIDENPELVNITNSSYEDDSPLLLAINRERYEIAEKLVKLGANINYQSEGGETPLMVAGGVGDVNSYDIITMLIESGADWNIKDLDGDDFLHYLTEEDEEKVIEDYPEKYEDYLLKKKEEKYNI